MDSLSLDDRENVGIDSVAKSTLIDDDSKQSILLQGNDNMNTYHIHAKHVDIASSKIQSQARTNASNKIKVNRIVNYDWEQRYNNGNLIAIHKSGQYFAYSIRVENAGKVRVFHKKLNEKALIKTFTGRVVDLSFAHYDADVLLGCVEENGQLQIFKIVLDANSKMETQVIFNLAPISNIESKSDTMHRIIWCMYIPDSSSEQIEPQLTEDAFKVFVLTRKNRSDIFHLDIIKQKYDCSKMLNADDLQIGHLVIDEHRSTILTASFSPDGSAIATSSQDGEVNFFKINFPSPNTNEMESDDGQLTGQEETKCLKKWLPHDGRPVNSLYFLDDFKNASPDAQFWSFILTGCDYNREIKIWSCLKWECLQTIRFMNEPDEQISFQPCIKSAIDLSSNYLVLSDITRKCFYVLHLFQDFDKSIAKCTSISEFALAYPALSFAIIDTQDVKARKLNQLTNNNNAIHNASSTINLDDESQTNDLLNISSQSLAQADLDNTITMIRLYCIQTKQLQEMQIFLTGDSFNSGTSSPLLKKFPQSLSFTDNLRDSKKSSSSNSLKISSMVSQEDTAVLNVIQSTNQPLLMTPDAFINSPRPNTASTSINLIDSTNASSLTHITTATNVQQHQQQQQQQQQQQIAQQRRRSRSSSSSSSTSSSSTTSSDSADKEIVNVLTIGDAKDSLLLNKVNIETNIEDEKVNLASNLLSSINIEKSIETTNNDLIGLLNQINQSLRKQNEEIESLKRTQLSSQQQLKLQIDNAFKQSHGQGGKIDVDFNKRLEKIIREEIGKGLQSQITHNLLEHVREQIARELAERFKSIENIIKDNVNKLFKSKSVLESLTQSVTQSMQALIVNSYRDTFQKTIVPNFEKACQNMYQQVNNSFSKGTQDYLVEFEQLARQYRKLFDENKDPLLLQLKQYNEQMHSNAQQVANEMASSLQQQFDSHLRNSNAILQDTIISSVKAIVKEEIHLAMRDQQHTLTDKLISQIRSGHVTPINLPSNSPYHHASSIATTTQEAQMQITSFLQKGQLNSAFQVALCAADLHLLMNLCELVNPTQVFEQTVNPLTKKAQCQLQQPVILSLIQQLSQDLSSNVELKVKYLEEAICNLDLTNALTREHTPAVIGQLIAKLQLYVQNHPNEKISKSIRMLIMASQSLQTQPKQAAMSGSNINGSKTMTNQKSLLHPNDNF
jgi:enhancer of mRNA-decapping protein 4